MSIARDKVNEDKVCARHINCTKEVDWEDVKETLKNFFNDVD